MQNSVKYLIIVTEIQNTKALVENCIWNTFLVYIYLGLKNKILFFERKCSAIVNCSYSTQGFRLAWAMNLLADIRDIRPLLNFMQMGRNFWSLDSTIYTLIWRINSLFSKYHITPLQVIVNSV